MITTDTHAPAGEVTVDGDDLRVVFRRHYRQHVEKVWAAVTSPERLADWLADAEIDMRVGGQIRLSWNGVHSMEGRIVALEPLRLFAWTWELDGRETIVRFEVEPEGDGCRLTLTHSGLSPRAGRGAGVRAGWHAHLEGVPDALDGRATPFAVKSAREAEIAPLYPALPG